MVLGLLVGAGCEPDQVKVKPVDSTMAYGRSELVAAVKLFTDGDRSPGSYRVMATAVAAAAPKFNEAVALEAERNLVFLALGPLDAYYDKPLAEQFDKLAATVWPTALEAEPRAGESAHAFIERICVAERASECKYVVPEYRPIILGEYVWQRLHERAREAYKECHECQGEATFTAALDQYASRAKHMLTRASSQESDAHPRRWPQAGSHAAPWSGVMVLKLSSDSVAIDGQAIPSGDLRSELKQRRKQAGEVLGVLLSPSSKVRELRELLGDAAAARFTHIALQARSVDYPYPLREYRLATRKGARGHRARVRDGDSIQVLIQVVDAALARGVKTPWL